MKQQEKIKLDLVLEEIRDIKNLLFGCGDKAGILERIRNLEKWSRIIPWTISTLLGLLLILEKLNII